MRMAFAWGKAERPSVVRSANRAVLRRCSNNSKQRAWASSAAQRTPSRSAMQKRLAFAQEQLPVRMDFS